MSSIIIRALISASIIVAVSEIAFRYPRVGALLLTLPVVSLLAFVMTWARNHELSVVSRLARETLVLVPLGLPFFVPLAFADRIGLGFWSAFIAGTALASFTIGMWFWLGPKPI